MPELPEVETVRRGIEPHLRGRTVKKVIVRCRKLRRPITPGLPTTLPGCLIRGVRRRAKYLLLDMQGGTLLVHLGMSGSLCLVPARAPPGLHDHLDLVLSGSRLLRFGDPRRFGTVLWLKSEPLRHPLLRDLGPEPLSPAFSGDYLYRCARGRSGAVKNFLMNSRVVAGIGNIYASEALFHAGIRPSRPAGCISAVRYARLADAVRFVLRAALRKGGTTLRDFVDSSGRPGYFRMNLAVYGRGGEPCTACGRALKQVRLGQRGTVFCPHCQT